MGNLVWGLVGAVVAGLFWLIWMDGRAAPGGFLFAQADATSEAGYCLAATERARGLTRGQGPPVLEAFFLESLDFWQLRAAGKGPQGAAALARDLAGVEESPALRAVLNACATRAVALYGHHFPSMEGADPLS